MPRARVVKVKRFPSQEDRDAVCYVGRRAWGWPGTPWANPHKPEPQGAGAACQDTTDASRRNSLRDCLNKFIAHAARQPDKWWAQLWAECDGGRLPLACFCAEGMADDLQGVCHAGILGAELNRRYVDGTPPGTQPSRTPGPGIPRETRGEAASDGPPITQERCAE